jgi:hypothetical protein
MYNKNLTASATAGNVPTTTVSALTTQASVVCNTMFMHGPSEPLLFYICRVIMMAMCYPASTEALAKTGKTISQVLAHSSDQIAAGKPRATYVRYEQVTGYLTSVPHLHLRHMLADADYHARQWNYNNENNGMGRQERQLWGQITAQSLIGFRNEQLNPGGTRAAFVHGVNPPSQSTLAARIANKPPGDRAYSVGGPLCYFDRMWIEFRVALASMCSPNSSEQIQRLDQILRQHIMTLLPVSATTMLPTIDLEGLDKLTRLWSPQLCEALMALALAPGSSIASSHLFADPTGAGHAQVMHLVQALYQVRATQLLPHLAPASYGFELYLTKAPGCDIKQWIDRHVPLDIRHHYPILPVDQQDMSQLGRSHSLDERIVYGLVSATTLQIQAAAGRLLATVAPTARGRQQPNTKRPCVEPIAAAVAPPPMPSANDQKIQKQLQREQLCAMTSGPETKPDFMYNKSIRMIYTFLKLGTPFPVMAHNKQCVDILTKCLAAMLPQPQDDALLLQIVALLTNVQSLQTMCSAQTKELPCGRIGAGSFTVDQDLLDMAAQQAPHVEECAAELTKNRTLRYALTTSRRAADKPHIIKRALCELVRKPRDAYLLCNIFNTLLTQYEQRQGATVLNVGHQLLPLLWPSIAKGLFETCHVWLRDWATMQQCVWLPHIQDPLVLMQELRIEVAAMRVCYSVSASVSTPVPDLTLTEPPSPAPRAQETPPPSAMLMPPQSRLALSQSTSTASGSPLSGSFSPTHSSAPPPPSNGRRTYDQALPLRIDEPFMAAPRPTTTRRQLDATALKIDEFLFPDGY